MHILILFLSIFISSQTFAQVAKISALNGDATIERDGQSITAKIGNTILEKDTIKTKDNSRLQMIFKDQTVITLGKNTVFSVQSYLYDETAQSNANFSLTKGFLKSFTGKLGKIAPKRFKIKTKTSTIGIRGTIFTIEANQQFTRLTTISGATYFIDDSSGQNYEVSKNQQLTYNQNTQKVDLKSVELSSEEPQSTTIESQSDADDNVKQADQNQQSSSIDTDIQETKDADDASQNTDSSNNNQGSTADTSTQKVISGSGTYARYGYWERVSDKQMTEAFAEAMPGRGVTPSSTINELVINRSQATYSGNVIAFDQPKNKGVGTINMTVNFNSSPAVTGSMDYTINGVRWNNDFEGNIDSTASSFQINGLSPKAGSNVNNPTGTMSGKFYGPTAQEAAGTFSLRGENSSNGVTVHSTGSFLGSQ